MAKNKKHGPTKLKPIIQGKKFKEWDGKCGYCGKFNDSEEDPHYILECPSCGRDGCGQCMPAGRGCDCPECEERGAKA